MIPIVPFIIFGALFAFRKKAVKSSSQTLESEPIDVLSNDSHRPTPLSMAPGESIPIQAILTGVGTSWDFVIYNPDSKAVSVSKSMESIGGGSTSQTFTIRALSKGESLIGFKKYSAKNVLDERFLSVIVI